jgi:hypothetical protein
MGDMIRGKIKDSDKYSCTTYEVSETIYNSAEIGDWFSYEGGYPRIEKN